jgi:hypothetical protein
LEPPQNRATLYNAAIRLWMSQLRWIAGELSAPTEHFQADTKASFVIDLVDWATAQGEATSAQLEAALRRRWVLPPVGGLPLVVSCGLLLAVLPPVVSFWGEEMRSTGASLSFVVPPLLGLWGIVTCRVRRMESAGLVLLSTLLLLGTLWTGRSAKARALEGFVCDPYGQPLPGVAVTPRDGWGRPLDRPTVAITDDQGHFVVELSEAAVAPMWLQLESPCARVWSSISPDRPAGRCGPGAADPMEFPFNLGAWEVRCYLETSGSETTHSRQR